LTKRDSGRKIARGIVWLDEPWPKKKLTAVVMGYYTVYFPEDVASLHAYMEDGCLSFLVAGETLRRALRRTRVALNSAAAVDGAT